MKNEFYAKGKGSKKVRKKAKIHFVIISRTNVASVGSVFNDTRKVKVLSLPETIKEKSTFRFSFIVSGSERTFTFRVSLNTLPTLATLVRDIITK